MKMGEIDMEENRNAADREEIICWCSNVSRGQIWDAMDRGARTLGDIQASTGACTLCQCAERNPRGTGGGGDIRRVMREYLAGQAKPAETNGEK